MSPFEIVTGQTPQFPFDVTEATWLVEEQDTMSTAELIALRARQLQRRPQDLARIMERISKARLTSIQQFEKMYANRIRDFDFQRGALVLVRNSKIEDDLDRKAKEKYYGPMLVVGRTLQGSYRLAELDGAIARRSFAAFRVIPYHARGHVEFPTDPGWLVEPDGPEQMDENDLREGEQDFDVDEVRGEY